MNEAIVLDRAEWLDWHHDPSKVSASQAAIILGQNAWTSGVTLGAQKLGKIDWPEETIAMRAGHAMEPIIAEEYTKATGIELTDEGDYTVHVHPKYKWLFSTNDRRGWKQPVGNGVVELKNTSSWMVALEWEHGPPLKDQIQVQTQMACTEVWWGALAGLALNRDFFQYPVERDSEFVALMISDLSVFRDTVMAGELPTAGAAPAQSSLATLKALHPKDNGETVTLGEAIYCVAEDWENTKAQIKVFEERKSALEVEIRAFMGDYTFAEHESILYSLKHQNRKGALRLELTEENEAALLRAKLNFEVTEPSETRVLRRLKNKGGK